MTGACTIDGIDIATLGVLILRGGDHGLISFPARKSPTLIEWPDADGFEIGADAPVFEAKKVTVHYYLKGDETNFKNRLNAFVALQESAGLRTVYLREFAQSFQLRYTGVSGFSLNRGFTVSGEKAAYISLDYVMDDPVQFLDPEITEATANRPIPTHVKIGGVDLAAFGIVVAEIYSGAFKSTAKKTLIYDSRYQNGQVVDTSYAPKKEKQQLTAKCTMLCTDRASFMTNWNALWNALAVSSLTLELTAAEKTFTAYYSSMGNFSKRPWTRRALAEFELNFIGYEL